MTAVRRAAFALAVCLAVPVMWAGPASAATALTVTPNTNLVDGQTVTIDGSGFSSSTSVGVCEAVMDASPGPEDCNNGGYATVGTSASGDFSVPFAVKQSIFVPSLGRVVHCWIESCFIGAADTSNVAGTAAFAPLTFVHVQPDAQVRRLSDNVIFGNDVYGTDGTGETVTHSVAPSGAWSFAVQVENDGARTENITVNAAAVLSAPGVSVRYFAGFIDVTSFVNGSGFTFANVPPGGIRKLPVQFTATSGASIGARSQQLVTFHVGAITAVDAVRVGVRVDAAT